MLNAKQNSLAFHDDELNYQYPLLNVSTVRSLEHGSDVMITPTATSLNIDVAPSLTVGNFKVEQGTTNNSKIEIKNTMTGSAWSSLYVESNGCVGHIISGINGAGATK